LKFNKFDSDSVTPISLANHQLDLSVSSS